MKLALLFVILSISTIALGQSSIDKWDKEWRAKTKGKLKKAKIGTLSNGFATFYFKSDKTIFSVEKRDSYKTDKLLDSAISFSANFRNDSLFRVVFRRFVPNEKQGVAILYLDGRNVLAKETDGIIFIPEILQIIERHIIYFQRLRN